MFEHARYIYRRVDTGEIVTKDFALKHPNLTVREVVYTPSPLRRWPEIKKQLSR